MDGEEIAGYIRGHKLISREIDGTTQYYLSNHHGDVNGLYTADGTDIVTYTYDAFGNRTATSDNTNPFGYCGEYTDEETGFIYLRNRYYDPSTGRFITEDPVKDGSNWYVYCGNNPVMFADPWGLEYIVVSGGKYSNTSDWGYEFIETAIKKIREWKDLNDGENISWLVANAGWTDNDINKFQEVANDLGVTLRMIDSADDFVEYINTKNGHDRYNDKIKKFAVFSHGKDTDGGTIELAYYHENPSKLQISIDTINNKLWSTAFDNPNSAFYACSLATTNNNFAKAWLNKFKGRVWAFYGKSTYTYINSGIHPAITMSRKKNGFSYYGSANYPVAGTTKINGIISVFKEVK